MPKTTRKDSDNKHGDVLVNDTNHNVLAIDHPMPLWSLGVAGGDIYATIVAEIKDEVAKARGHQLNALKAGIQRLQQQNLVSEHEAKDMSAICDIVFDVRRKKQNIAQARKAVSAMYRKMIVESNNGSVALVFASIVANENGPLKVAVPDVPEGAVASLSEDEATGIILVGAIGGAIGGALAGAKLGGEAGSALGVIGAIAGAIIGGAIGAAVVSCAD